MFSDALKVVGLGFAAVFATVLSAQSEPVKIGSKNFTEQFIVAEIYAQALEKAGSLKRIPFADRDKMKALVDPELAAFAKEIEVEEILAKINAVQ